MKKIYIVNKTHLDIGFTDFGVNVLKKYCDTFIPNAIQLAEEMEKQDKKFVWTVGSFIIQYFLDNMNAENCARLEAAIKKGHIRWHAMAATFQCELLTEEHLDYMCRLTKELDAKYGVATTSAKMTDVPGHTIGIVKTLHKYGIKFLHIGVNGVSTIPDVPDNFLWKIDDSEIVVSYSKDYGGLTEVDGFESKLLFMHTLDNKGPGTIENVSKFCEDVRNKYSDHDILVTSLDDFADEIWEIRHQLPVVTEEIGDTWVHGAFANPKVTRGYRILMDLIKGNREVDERVYFYAFLIPEHTWGFDLKKYHGDYVNWSKDAFQKARKENKITDESLGYGYGLCGEKGCAELEELSDNKWTDRTYSLLEESWAEQYQHLLKAASYLPADIKAEFEKRLEIPYADFIIKGHEVKPGQKIAIGAYEFIIGPNGSIIDLAKDGCKVFDANNQLGVLNYTIPGLDSYDNLKKHYMRDLHKHWWAIDFWKPGMEAQKEIHLTTEYRPLLDKIFVDEENVIISAGYCDEAIDKFGAPREVLFKYNFKEQITIQVLLKDKDAIKYPEIYSFGIAPLLNNPMRTKFKKIDTYVSPFDVVSNGNKILHVVNEVYYEATDKTVSIKPFDLPLVGLGTDNNLSFNNQYHGENEFRFTLLNTTWGTNFTMWWEDDLYATYTVSINASAQ